LAETGPGNKRGRAAMPQWSLISVKPAASNSSYEFDI